jgi:Transglycosylase SLT domain
MEWTWVKSKISDLKQRLEKITTSNRELINPLSGPINQPTPTPAKQTWEELEAISKRVNAPIPSFRYAEFGKVTPTNTPTVQPTVQPTIKPTNPIQPKPTPTPVTTYNKQGEPHIWETTKNPHLALVKQIWQGVEPTNVSNVMARESSWRPNLVHVNTPDGGFHQAIKDPNELNELLRKHGSVDIGLMQINNAPAVEVYLRQKGLKWTDLLDPATNLQVAYDLYSGRIPKTASGWGNWAVAGGLGLV